MGSLLPDLYPLPLIADDIADAMISAGQMIYAVQMNDTFSFCLGQVEKKIYDISVKIVFGI